MPAGSASPRTAQAWTTLPLFCRTGVSCRKSPSTVMPVSSASSRLAAASGSSSELISPFGMDQAPSSLCAQNGPPGWTRNTSSIPSRWRNINTPALVAATPYYKRMTEHRIERDTVHFKWDRANPPAVEIDSGDVVHCETNEVSDGQIRPGSPASVFTSLDFNRLYPLAGPVFVRGAEPGDTLQVDILSLSTLQWGWAGIIPGLGLLGADFSEPYIRHFDLTNGVDTPLTPDIRIPIAPFCGTMGV